MVALGGEERWATLLEYSRRGEKYSCPTEVGNIEAEKCNKHMLLLRVRENMYSSSSSAAWGLRCV